MQAAATRHSAVSPPADTLMSTTHPYLHPKARVGMTSTTKLHYDQTEQRFSLDDMQPQAVSNSTKTHTHCRSTHAAIAMWR